MLRFATLLAFLVIGTACSRGINSSPNLPPQNPSATRTVTVALRAGGNAQTLPSVDGVSTSITVPPNNAPIGTTLSITVSSTPIGGTPAIPAAQSKAFVYYALTSSADATLNGIPAFHVTLPSAPHDQGQFYAWTYNQTEGWTDWGAVTVSGSTLTFGGTSKPLLLKKGVQLAVVPFTASAGASCGRSPSPSPIPSPSPTPSPTPVAAFTPSPLQTFSPSSMPRYRFVPLPSGFRPYEINDNGVIAGYTTHVAPGRGHINAALYEDGQLVILGTLPGDTESVAYGVNDKNQAVGWSSNPSSSYPTNLEKAVLYSHGHVYDLHEPGTGYAINNEDIIVGAAYRGAPGSAHLTAVLFDASTCTPILYPFSEPPYSYSLAGRINDAGQYVGTFGDSHMEPQAYVASGATINPLGIAGYANDINNNGDIVGTAHAGMAAMPYIRNGATGAITVPVLRGFSAGGDAIAINDAGEVIGNSYSPTGQRSGFFYQSGKIASLEQISGMPELSPTDINDRGEIAVIDYSNSEPGVLEPVR